jgi:small subunit ribosomal protein S3Ae
VSKFIPDTIGKEIERATEGTFPLQNVLIRKVKMLRAPKTDMAALLALHGGSDAAAAVSSSSTAVDLGKAVEEKKKE